jgi:hypothetical protein
VIVGDIGSAKSKIAAAVAFASPAIVAVIAAYLEKSSLRNSSAYQSSIRVAVFVSLVAAFIVPAIVIWRLPISVAARLAGSVAALALLVVELYATFFFVVVQG